MDQKFVKWEPNTGLLGKYLLNGLSEDENGLELILSLEGNNTKLILKWECIVESYMCSQESSRSILYDNEIAKWSFYQVINSKYLNWLCEQSLGICEYRPLKHFCIICNNSVIDIISELDPIALIE